MVNLVLMLKPLLDRHHQKRQSIGKVLANLSLERYPAQAEP